MDITSGECVSLVRQYTFKTTVDTEWIEEHLEKLPKRARSEFIRNCIISQLESGEKSHMSHVSHKEVTPKVTHEEKVHEATPWTPSPEDTSDLFGEGEVTHEEIDLDKALDNLNF